MFGIRSYLVSACSATEDQFQVPRLARNNLRALPWQLTQLLAQEDAQLLAKGLSLGDVSLVLSLVLGLFLCRIERECGTAVSTNSTSAIGRDSCRPLCWLTLALTQTLKDADGGRVIVDTASGLERFLDD